MATIQKRLIRISASNSRFFLPSPSPPLTHNNSVFICVYPNPLSSLHPSLSIPTPINNKVTDFNAAINNFNDRVKRQEEADQLGQEQSWENRTLLKQFEKLLKQLEKEDIYSRLRISLI